MGSPISRVIYDLPFFGLCIHSPTRRRLPLLSAVLKHSELVPGRRKAEVVIMSRNNADTSLRISKSIESFKLDITRAHSPLERPL